MTETLGRRMTQTG